MAHNLYRDSMAYMGETPWHQLGVQFEGKFTAEQAIVAANLGYTVEKVPLFMRIPGNGVDVPESFVKTDGFATVNSDTNDILGYVRSRYTPLQNRAAFGFFDELIEEGGAHYVTAGALGKGERIWLLAQMPETFEPLAGDVSKNYCLLSNSHDGNSPVTVRFTQIRVVCQNTLTAAMKGTKETISVRHSTNVEHRLRTAASILREYRDHMANLGEVFTKFTAITIDDAWIDEYIDGLFGLEIDIASPAGRTRRQNNVNTFMRYVDSGRGTNIPGVKGTVWGAYNAAVEFADYEVINRADDRIQSILYGTANNFRQKAFDLALSMTP